MANSIVVALFESKSEADNARHRLVTEGVADADIGERVLHEVSPIPHVMELEVHPAGAAMDPFAVLFGRMRHNYADYIKNGETALAVRVPDDEQAEAVESIILMFEPVRIDRLFPALGGF